jgi:hypothetical protein
LLCGESMNPKDSSVWDTGSDRATLPLELKPTSLASLELEFSDSRVKLELAPLVFAKAAPPCFEETKSLLSLLKFNSWVDVLRTSLLRAWMWCQWNAKCLWLCTNAAPQAFPGCAPDFQRALLPYKKVKGSTTFQNVWPRLVTKRGDVLCARANWFLKLWIAPR